MRDDNFLRNAVDNLGVLRNVRLAERKEVFRSLGEGRRVDRVGLKAVVDKLDEIAVGTEAGSISIVETGGAEEPGLEAGRKRIGAIRRCHGRGLGRRRGA